MKPGGRGALLANQAATAATTTLVGISENVGAGQFGTRQVWRATCWLQYLHTAAATPTLTFELAIGGTVLCSCILTPIATAGTYHGRAEATFTFRSEGSTAAVVSALDVSLGAGTQASDMRAGFTNITPASVNTTIARLVELRARMTTAVAGNTLTISQGYLERVCG